MPEEAARPIGAVPVHQRKDLRIVTKFHKREKNAFPKEVAIIIRCTATGNVLFFGLAKQETVPNSTRENGPQQHFVSFPQVRRGK